MKKVTPSGTILCYDQLVIDHISQDVELQPTFSPVKPITLSSQITSQIREAILRGKLKPGQRLVERELAKATGASQVTIREALQPLQHEGLVIKKTNAASFVMELSRERLREILDVRLLLEPHAVGLASERLTPERMIELRERIDRLRRHASAHDLYQCSRDDFEFHRTLWECCGNETLTRTLTAICTSYFAYTSILPGLSKADLEGRIGPYEVFRAHWLAGVEKRFDAHQELLEVVAAGNRENVEEEVRRHIRAGWNWLLEPELCT